MEHSPEDSAGRGPKKLQPLFTIWDSPLRVTSAGRKSTFPPPRENEVLPVMVMVPSIFNNSFCPPAAAGRNLRLLPANPVRRRCDQKERRPNHPQSAWEPLAHSRCRNEHWRRFSANYRRTPPSPRPRPHKAPPTPLPWLGHTTQGSHVSHFTPFVSVRGPQRQARRPFWSLWGERDPKNQYLIQVVTSCLAPTPASQNF